MGTPTPDIVVLPTNYVENLRTPRDYTDEQLKAAIWRESEGVKSERVGGPTKYLLELVAEGEIRLKIRNQIAEITAAL